MGLSKFNKAVNHKWSIDTEGFEYKKCSEMPIDTELPLKGCFITADNGYGKGAVFITNKNYVNIPQRYVEMVQEILKDDESINQIESGHAAFKITTFTNKQKKLCYSIDLLDI